MTLVPKRNNEVIDSANDTPVLSRFHEKSESLIVRRKYEKYELSKADLASTYITQYKHDLFTSGRKIYHVIWPHGHGFAAKITKIWHDWGHNDSYRTQTGGSIS